MKRRDVVLIGSGLAAAWLVGCSDPVVPSGTGGATGSGGGSPGGGGTPGGSGGSGDGGTPGGSGGSGDGGTPGAGGTPASGGAQGSGGAPGSGGAGSGGAPGTGGGGGVDCSEVASEETTTPALPHVHTLLVPEEDVTAGTEKTYTTSSDQGQTLHSHTVLVTAANFTTLKTTGTVDVLSISTSSGADHVHKYTVTCG